MRRHDGSKTFPVPSLQCPASTFSLSLASPSPSLASPRCNSCPLQCQAPPRRCSIMLGMSLRMPLQNSSKMRDASTRDISHYDNKAVRERRRDSMLRSTCTYNYKHCTELFDGYFACRLCSSCWALSAESCRRRRPESCWWQRAASCSKPSSLRRASTGSRWGSATHPSCCPM